MRTAAICGRNISERVSTPDTLGTIQIAGVPITCGLIHVEDTAFDRRASANRFNVLVKVKAFSCNYRDKSLILQAARKGTDYSFYVIGSDFVGEVVDVGAEVDRCAVGDRVIADNCWPGRSLNGIPPGGVPTNHASKEYQVFHQEKLIRIPRQMPDEVAAAFSIGAQTAYSMVRKLQVSEGARILVTAAKSNTSLFIINALKGRDIHICATSTSTCWESEIRALGVKEFVLIDPALESFSRNQKLNDIIAKAGPFEYVCDPFFDIHLGKVVELMAPGARYITCGLFDQYLSFIGEESHYSGLDLRRILGWVLVNNLQIIGNCLGQTKDLSAAIQDYASGSFNVVVDSVFQGGNVADFLNQTYNAKDRFGKVVYRYD